MKVIFKYLVGQFFYITTLILIGIAIVAAFDSSFVVDNLFLIKLVLTGCVSTIPTIIFFIPKMNFKLKILIHYLILNIVILSMGYLLEFWYGDGWKFIVILILFVYIFVWILEYVMNQREANNINNEIKKIRDED